MILGALITVINAVDSFFDFRSLWIHRTITLSKLWEIKRELIIYKIDNENKEISAQELNKISNRLNKVLRDDIKLWLKLRDDDEEKAREENK